LKTTSFVLALSLDDNIEAYYTWSGHTE